MREQFISEIVLVGHRVYALEDVTAAAVSVADALVSIGDPEDSVPYEISLSKKRYLALNFYDFEHEYPKSPQLSHVHDLIAFAKETKAGEKLLVHCYAGISRSTASLAIILAVLHPKLGYDEIFEAVYRIRSEAWPNARLIAHADQILRCNGEFNAALERFKERITQAEG